MNKYLLFCGDDYYPSGGFQDYYASYETVEDAVKEGKHRDWYHVIDQDTLKEVANDWQAD